MSTRQIVHDPRLRRYDAIGPSGELMGSAYKDGVHGMYVARVAGEVFRTWDLADALLWLSLKTDTKEGVHNYFYPVRPEGVE